MKFKLNLIKFNSKKINEYVNLNKVIVYKIYEKKILKFTI